VRHARATVTAALFTVLAEGAAGAAVEHASGSIHGGFGLSRLAFDATVDAAPDPYLLLAIVTADGAPPVRSATFAGTPLGLLGAVSSPGAHCRIEWWGQLAPVAGTHAAVVDLSTSAAFLQVSVLTYRGVSPLHPTGPVVTTAGTGDTSITITAAAAGDVVLDGVCAWSASSIIETAGPKQIGRWHYSVESLSAAGSERPGAIAGPLTWTAGGSGNMEWGALGIALLAADGTGGRLPTTVNLDVGTAGCAVGRADSQPPPGALSGIVVGVLGWLWMRRRREPKPHVRVEPAG
jgi:MYXO-CTERM domain-containing protein